MHDPIHAPRRLAVIAQILTQDSHEALSPEYIRILAALGLPSCVQAFSSPVNAVMHEFLIVGFSCCRAWALGTQASVALVLGFSCPSASGIFPDQGLNPCPLN